MEITAVAFLGCLVALHCALMSAEAKPQPSISDASQQDYLSVDGDVLMAADSEASNLAKDIQWLKLAAAAERLRPLLAAKFNEGQASRRVAPLGARKVNKRHCWDVADVCCMWNIC